MDIREVRQKYLNGSDEVVQSSWAEDKLRKYVMSHWADTFHLVL